MNNRCAWRTISASALVALALSAPGSIGIQPDTAVLKGVSFSPSADGTTFVVRLVTDDEIPWFSREDKTGPPGVRVVLLNTTLLDDAELADAVPPIAGYDVSEESNKVVVDVSFDAPTYTVHFGPDSENHDMLLTLTNTAGGRFASLAPGSSSGNSLAVLEALAARADSTDAAVVVDSASIQRPDQPERDRSGGKLESVDDSNGRRTSVKIEDPEEVVPESVASTSLSVRAPARTKAPTDVDRLFSSVLKKKESAGAGSELPGAALNSADAGSKPATAEPADSSDSPPASDVASLPAPKMSPDVRWKLDTVVLDAGHGGWDEGAFGAAGLLEKDLALKVATLVGNRLSRELGIRVVYTRSDDRFVPLAERGRIANQAEGKLFISIHANSAKARSAKGTETFFLGTHRSDSARVVMERENEVIKLEKDQGIYSQFDNASLAQQALAQSSFMRHSEMLALAVQNEFTESVGRLNRGVKQAGFYVLFGASMPAVLIELGFLTNPREEKFLSTTAGQTSMAHAIFRAVSEYRKAYEQSLRVAAQ